MEDRSENEWASERLVKKTWYRLLLLSAAVILIVCFVLLFTWESLPKELGFLDRTIVKIIAVSTIFCFTPAITAAHAPTARKNAKVFDPKSEQASPLFRKLRRIGFSCLLLSAAFLLLMISAIESGMLNIEIILSILGSMMIFTLIIGVAAFNLITMIESGALIPPKWLLRFLGEDEM